MHLQKGAMAKMAIKTGRLTADAGKASSGKTRREARGKPVKLYMLLFLNKQIVGVVALVLNSYYVTS